MDLWSENKEYIVHPKTLVNIKALPGLNKIEPGSQAWTIGTNVTIAELEDHAELKKTFPGLQQAAAEVGSRQIRNSGTVGGNLGQHSRCWYYRHRDVLCLKKGGDMCYARHGDNRYHSLFTGNTCISPVVSNLAIVLGALDAVVIVQRGGNPAPDHCRRRNLRDAEAHNSSRRAILSSRWNCLSSSAVPAPANEPALRIRLGDRQLRRRRQSRRQKLSQARRWARFPIFLPGGCGEPPGGQAPTPRPRPGR